MNFIIAPRTHNKGGGVAIITRKYLKIIPNKPYKAKLCSRFLVSGDFILHWDNTITLAELLDSFNLFNNISHTIDLAMAQADENSIDNVLLSSLISDHLIISISANLIKY